MRRFLHRLAHLTGANRGHVVSCGRRGVIWIGFRCSTCGKIAGKHVPVGAAPRDAEFS